MAKNIDDLPPLPGGEKDFVNYIYKHFFDRLLFYCFKFIANPGEAEDIVNESIIEAWQKHKTTGFETPIHLQNFLFAVVRNRTYNWLRDNNRRGGTPLSFDQLDHAEPAALDSPSEKAHFKIVLSQLAQILPHLPEQAQKVVRMRITEGLTPAEIAEQLRISRETVYKHIANAKRIILIEFNKKGPDSL
jgi:RNA polymerase sigma-70 factor (ECF subfamily)